MIVAVLNIKGGVGKTTSAMALAIAAARKGLATKVLDADPQGSASLWAELAERDETPLPFEVDPANVVTLRRLRGSDDLVFIDCPPSGNVTDAALEAADVVVIPTAPSAADLQQSWRTIGVVESQGKDYAVLLTQARSNTLALAEALEALEAQGASYFTTQIPLREGIKNAFGTDFSGNLQGYDQVLEELLEMMGEN